MKSTIFSLLSFFALTNLFAQNNSFVNITEETVIIEMGKTVCGQCKNKAVVPIKLPENAEGYIYSVTFVPKENKLDKSADLYAEVVLLNKEIPAENISDYIQPMQTNRSGNIYIIRGKEYADSFSRCGFFYHHRKYIGSKSKSGYIENTEGETFYIGIEKPSVVKGLVAKVEVVAVI